MDKDRWNCPRRPMRDCLPEGFAEAVLEQLHEGVLITEGLLEPPGPRILWVNSAWERITGYSAKQAVGATPPVLQDPGAWRELLDQARADPESTAKTQAEVITSRPEGTSLRVAMSISPVRDPNGVITHFAAIQREVTRDRVASSQLRQLEALTRIQREIARGDSDLKQVRQRMADTALQITGADGAVVEEVAGEEIVYRAVAGIAKDYSGLRLPLDQSLSRRVYRDGTPRLCRNIEVDSGMALNEEARRIGFVSGILVPLSHKGGVFGMLKVFAAEAGRFSMEHQQLLGLASGVLAASLSRASEQAAELERHTALMDAVPVMISFVDNDLRFQEVNAAYERFFGRAAEEIRGRFLWEILGGEGYECVRPYAEAALRGERVGFENDVVSPDGTIRTVHGDYCPRFERDGRVQGFYAIVRDVTEARSSRVDYLIGLANRRQFDCEGARLIEVGRRHKEPVTLVMLDLDHFKAINDIYGHAAGDEVLKEIASLMRLICRQSDLAGRWGGEEFVLLLPKTDAKGGMGLAERLRSEIAEHGFPGVGSVTVSLGVASARAGEDLPELMERVDRALYRAKQAGRNRVEVDSRA